MSRKNRKYSALPLPSRQVTMRAGRVLLVSGLALLFIMAQRGNPYATGLKAQLGDAIAPVLAVAASPFDALRGTTQGMKNWALAYQQNIQLKNENRELLKWQAMAKDMQAENDKLRGLLNVAPRRGMHFVSATIVSDHGSSFSSAAIIHAGVQEGVGSNQAVISERGLVGRITQAGNHSAQVLLLTDLNSRIPVMNERTREKMILVGKGDGLPQLSYVSTDSASRKGDRIVTSGDGGVFAKNIPVGTIRDASKGSMAVELFATLADIEYVSVVQYDK